MSVHVIWVVCGCSLLADYINIKVLILRLWPTVSLPLTIAN